MIAKMSVGRPIWKVYLKSSKKTMVTYPKMALTLYEMVVETAVETNSHEL